MWAEQAAHASEPEVRASDFDGRLIVLAEQ
jgi:hypothetical protein